MTVSDSESRARVPELDTTYPIFADEDEPLEPTGLGGFLRSVPRRLTWVISMGILFALWEIAPRVGWVNEIIVPPASTVMQALYDLARSGVLWDNVSASLRRAATGFAIACAGGIGLGLVLGWSSHGRRWLAAPLEFFRQIPPLAIFPVFLLILGLGFRAQVAMVVWAAIWPIMLNTISGCQQVDPALVKAARSFGMKQRTMFAKVVLPSSLPMISTGVRLGGTYALLVLVGAEMVGAQSGIGYLIINSQYALQIPNMYAAIITIALLGLTLNFLLLRLEAWMSKWREHEPAK